MARIRIVLEAEYWIESPSEVIQIQGEDALKIGGRILKPFVEFSWLKTQASDQTTWEPQTRDSESEMFDAWVSEKREISVIADSN